MKVSRTSSYRVNLPYFERREISNTVTVDHIDLGYTDEEWAEGMRDENKTAQQEKELLQYADEMLGRVEKADLDWVRQHCEPDRSVFGTDSRSDRRGR
jgi:hypothetical protein